MLVKTKAIVISSLRYQEKSLIVKCFTQSNGLKSYFIRDAFSGKKSAQKIAYFQPLSLLEIEAAHKNKGRLEYFKEIKLAHPYHTITTSITKTTIILFLSEILHYSIKEEEKNEELYFFLETAMLWLDSHNDIANFHLILMLEITKFLGFYPDATQNNDGYFEMIEGIFIPTETLTCLSGYNTGLFRRLMLLRFGNTAKAFNVSERQALLKILLDYFALHLDNFKAPKSLEVLKEIFI